jgi:hypothetical protein
MERSYRGSTKHPHAINVCDFTANFRLALLSAPLRRAPAVLAGSGKVLRVWAEARKVMCPATVHCQHLNNCARRVLYLDLTPDHRS